MHGNVLLSLTVKSRKQSEYEKYAWNENSSGCLCASDASNSSGNGSGPTTPLQTVGETENQKSHSLDLAVLRQSSHSNAAIQ